MKNINFMSKAIIGGQSYHGKMSTPCPFLPQATTANTAQNGDQIKTHTYLIN